MAPLSRRAMLQSGGSALIAGLTGCLSGVPQSTPDATPDEEPPDGFWRWVTVTESDSPPEQYQVSLTVDVVQSWATAEQMAYFEVTLTNDSDEARELGPVVDGPDFPANNVNGIVLFDETGDSEPNPPWCVNTDGKADERVGYGGGMKSPHEVEAGGSVTRRIGIFDDQNVRGCLPPGLYPFKITHTVRPTGEAEDGGPKEGTTYDWKFTLGIRGDDEESSRT